MRTPSQIFADEWNASEYQKCRHMIETHGFEETKALLWIALSGNAPVDFLQFIRETPKNSPSSHSVAQALSMIMTHPSSKERTPLLQFFFNSLSDDVLVKENFFHRAAQVNCVETMELFLTRFPDFYIDSLSTDTSLSALTVSLSYTQMDTTVFLYKRKANEHCKVGSGHKTTAFDWARLKNMNELEKFKTFHKNAVIKSLLEEAVSDQKEKKKKSNKKM